ncbi:MAG: class I SAM-dependent methyltransferase [Rudaea sp.]
MAWDLVADIYDQYVTTDLDIPFFLEEAGQAPGGILELMCGTGRVSLPLLAAGAHLTLVDGSPRMLQVLRRKLAQQGFSPPVYEMDVRALALPSQFDLILVPFNAFSELIAAEDRRETLRRIYEHLAAGGRAIVTLHNPKVRLKTVDEQLKLAGRRDLPGGTLLFWMWQKYLPEEERVTGLQFYEHYDQGGLMASRRMLEINFALVGDDEFGAMAKAAGFKVEELFGDYTRAPFDRETTPYQIWVLRK